MVRELGDDARAIVHLLLEGEVPQVPVLLVNLSPASATVEQDRRGRAKQRDK